MILSLGIRVQRIVKKTCRFGPGHPRRNRGLTSFIPFSKQESFVVQNQTKDCLEEDLCATCRNIAKYAGKIFCPPHRKHYMRHDSENIFSLFLFLPDKTCFPADSTQWWTQERTGLRDILKVTRPLISPGRGHAIRLGRILPASVLGESRNLSEGGNGFYFLHNETFWN